MKSRRQSSVEHRISAVEPYTFPAASAHDDTMARGSKFSPPADQIVRANPALDLALEQITRQARVSTCATGAFIGLLIIVVLRNGLNVIGVSSVIETLILGILILVAVGAGR